MTPNIINTLLGLILVYAAVLDPTLMAGQFYAMPIVALAIFALAIWARRSDDHHWQGTINIIMAILLGMLALLPLNTYPVVIFWGEFWVGVIVAVMALWAALYRPRGSPVVQ